MGSPLEQLLSMRTSADRYRIEPRQLVSLQMQAASERLETRIERIPLLRNRADAVGVTTIAEPADLVPVLFAHSAYKSYAESWLVEGRWDRMAKWLRTVSTDSLDGVDLAGVASLDDFVRRLEKAGCYVNSSSGTTGKPALIASSDFDLDFATRSNINELTWAIGVAQDGDRKVFGVGPRPAIERVERSRVALTEAFSSEERAYYLQMKPITIGSIVEMITLRRRIIDGAATPSQVAEFENLGKERLADMATALDAAVAEMVDSRGEKLLIVGMPAPVYEMAQKMRAKGLGREDFHPENALMVAGGLKGNALPENFLEDTLDVFNIRGNMIYQVYTMQELNTAFPKCTADRYHIPPWVIMLPLDEPGEKLLDTSSGPVEGRAAFFDLSLDGRWGGVISGDRVHVDFGTCECSCQGPTIGYEIVRYADLLSGDKISCAGTIDAYVRGEA